jgi:hypothetical protein
MSFTPQALNYFPTLEDAENSTNVMFQDTSFTITEQGGYAAWIVVYTNTVSLDYNTFIPYSVSAELNHDAYAEGDNSAQYFLYPAFTVYFLSSAMRPEDFIANSSYTIAAFAGYSNWVISENSTGIYDRTIYTVNETLNEGGTYFLYPEATIIPQATTFTSQTEMTFTPQALNYFLTQTDAQNSTNVIFQDTSFTITEQAGYAAWAVDTVNSVSLGNNSGVAFSVSAELNNDALTEGDNSAQYFLYPATIVYSYNLENIPGNVGEVQLEYSTTYTITTVSGYSNWVIQGNSTGSSPERILYTAGQTLTTGGTYFLFPEPVIWYYANRANAQSRSNAIANTFSGFGRTSYTIGSSLFSNWTIASNSTGTSSRTNVYSLGDILEGEGYVFNPEIPAPSYYLYPTVTFTPQALNYFPTQADAQNGTNVISQSSNFTISSINQYVFWKIDTNTISFDYDSEPHRVGETLSSDGLMVGDGLAQYYLYPLNYIPKRLNYFLDGENPIYQDEGYTVTTRLNYQAWRIYPILTISLSTIDIVFNGQTLSSDGIVSGDGAAEYYLYVGPRVLYFLNESDALARVNYIFDAGSYGLINPAGRVPPGLSNWRIAANSTGVSSRNFSYVAKQALIEGGTYYVYISSNTYRPSTVSYFPTRLDAQNRTNVIYESNAQNQNDMAYTIQTFNGYASWAIDSTHSINGSYASGTNLVLAYNTGKSLLNVYSHSDNPFIYLYPVSIVYYANKSNALAVNNYPDINQLAISTSYTLSNVGGFSNWVVASNSTGSSSQSVIYTSGQTLNAGGTYFLYSPPPTIIYYYENQSDALSSTNSIVTANSFSIQFNPVNTVIATNGWKIASNSTGTSSNTGVFREGNILDQGGIYHLYPNLPYATGGSNPGIVSTVNGIVTVVTLESLTVGSNLRNFLETFNT